jgi:hypothetical protein
MARRGWLTSARALLSGTVGTLGGLLGATLGAVVGVAIAVETAPTRDIPAHEDFIGGFLILFRAAAGGAIGAVVGAIAGAVLGSLAGTWAAGKALPTKGPAPDDQAGGAPGPGSRPAGE